jgi:5'-nucleotidase/UDP-sugar diphosphatase
VILLLLACTKPVAPPEVPAGPVALTILDTNDVHGHYLPEPAEWLPDRPLYGGFVRLEQEVRAIRASRPADAVLLLDGGDQLTGTPLTDLEVDGSRGGAMHALFAALHYDAWAVGNHEFDKGLDNLSAYTANHPVLPLSANLRGLDGAPLLPRQEASHVFVKKGVRIGVIGLTTQGLRTLMNKADFARLQLQGEVDAAAAEVARLDPVTDLILVLSHIGVENDVALAERVHGIDLIVGAHSHTRLESAKKVGDTWIVQAGSYGRELGVVDLTVGDDAIASFEWHLHELAPDTATVPPDPALQALVESYRARIDEVYGEVVSTAPATLGHDYHHESPLGRWITDALRDGTGADVAFYNGGGLRADLSAGPVTRGMLFNCFPFGNAVMSFHIDGSTLMGIVLGNLAADFDESRGFLSTSGLTWTWRVRDGAPEVVDVRVGGAPLELTRSYTAVTTSYIAEQWQKHLGVEPKDLEARGYTDFDAAVAFAKKGPVVDPPTPRAVRLQR